MSQGFRVDDRWSGNHGIGRYSAEVLKRISVPWEPMGLNGSPSAPADLIRRLPGAKDQATYSPGYNVFLGYPNQYVTVHDLIHLSASANSAKYRAYYALVRRVVRRSGLVFTVSDTSAGELREWIGSDDVSIVNTRGGCSAEFKRDESRAASAEPYFVCVGNSRQHKNLRVLFDALRIAKIPGVFVVPPTEQEELERAAHAFGVGDLVTLKSGLTDSEMAAIYRGAQFTAFPSLLEGFGLPALESIRCGTPVVYWRGCQPVSEIVGENGVALHSATDAEEWAHAMLSATQSRIEVADDAGQAFTWDAAAARVSTALEGVR